METKSKKELQALSDEDLRKLMIPPNELPAEDARWIYESLAKPKDNKPLMIACLETIAFSEARWIKDFLWKEVHFWKQDPFGEWPLIALSRNGLTKNEIRRLIRLYRDPQAHDFTKGSAIMAIGSQIQISKKPNPRHLRTLVNLCRETSESPIPYIRAGSSWMAKSLPNCEDILQKLSTDQEVVHPGEGSMVASYANS